MLFSFLFSTFQLDTDSALQLCIETHLQNASMSHAEGYLGGHSGKQTHALVVARAAETIPLLKSTTDLVTSLSVMLHKVKLTGYVYPPNLNSTISIPLYGIGQY